MKRGAWVAIAVLLLGGCASTGDITHNTPTFQGRTTKLDSAYAACVQSRWVAISPSTRTIETPASLEVVVSNATTHVEELLVIHSRATGADIVLYERMQILALRGYRETAKACL